MKHRSASSHYPQTEEGGNSESEYDDEAEQAINGSIPSVDHNQEPDEETESANSKAESIAEEDNELRLTFIKWHI